MTGLHGYRKGLIEQDKLFAGFETRIKRKEKELDVYIELKRMRES